VIGEVDDSGRAILKLRVQAAKDAAAKDLLVWVDTAFDGELVVPYEVVHELGLRQSAAVKATLADGTETVLETFDCVVEWFGVWRQVEVFANQGRWPLLGVGLLRGRKLTLDYQTNELVLV
jgi:clan AA aspartic protease